MGDNLLGNIVRIFLFFWLYSKLLVFLESHIYTWLYRFTMLIGVIVPEIHQKLYAAPFTGWVGGWIDIVLYFLAPAIVLGLVVVIIVFYGCLAGMAQESFREGKFWTGIGHMLVLAAVEVLHTYIFFSTQPFILKG